MKASELMQGDLVLYEYNGEKIHARVVEIYRSSALVESVSKEYEPIEIAEDKLFPVAIAPEILKKNGFKDEGYFWKLDIEDFHVLCDTKNVAIFHNEHTDVDIPIMYVHELQRSLRLCGIEKEMTI